VDLFRDRLDLAGVTGPEDVPVFRDATGVVFASSSVRTTGQTRARISALQKLLDFLHQQANDASVDEAGLVVFRELEDCIQREIDDGYDGA
jgi:hypothetical protein